MKDMTCSFAAAWVRETRAARNAAQNNTTVGVPGARCQERHAGGPPPSGWSTFGVKWKSSAPARSSTRGGVLGKGGAMRGRYRLRRRRWATGLRAERTDRKPCDPLIPYRVAWARSSPSEQIASKATHAVGSCWWHSPRFGPSEFARVAQPTFGSSTARVPVLVLGV